MTRSKRMALVQTPAPLEPEQFTLAMATLHDDDPRWRAVLQLLGDHITTAADRACDKRAADKPGSMAHAAGGLCWLQDFRDSLIAERNRALRIQPAGTKEPRQP